MRSDGGTVSAPAGPGCEALGDGLLAEPVAAVSSLAFVVAAAAALALARRREASPRHDTRVSLRRDTPTTLRLYAALVAGVGLGSLVQHGPDPWWSGVAHDVPLMGTLALVAADGVADLARRRRRAWWWLLPTAAVVPAALTSATVSTLAQSFVAGGAIGVTLLRAWRRPHLRRPVVGAVALLAVGSAIGTLSRPGGPLCDPESLWQGHAVWHVLASTALVVLTPAVGSRPAR